MSFKLRRLLDAHNEEVRERGGEDLIKEEDREKVLALSEPLEFWKEEVDETTGEVRDVPIDKVTADQAYKDSTDVKKILKRFQIKGAMSHLMEFPPEAYGVFEGVDLLEAHNAVTKAREVFEALPSEVRNDFGNDAFAFAAFASDPVNNSKLGELLPKIAEPGSYFPNPVKRGGDGAGSATPPKSASRAAEPTSSAGKATPEAEPSLESSAAEAAPASSST